MDKESARKKLEQYEDRERERIRKITSTWKHDDEMNKLLNKMDYYYDALYIIFRD